MAKIISGELIGKGKKVGIVIARFNDFITQKLLTGALDVLTREGVDEDAVDIVYVPGAFEIPATAKKLVQSGRYDGIMCLGAVIRGATPHFEFVSSEVSKGIAQVALNSEIPVIYGIITADTVDQAIERAGTKMGNRGAEAALALIEMINVYEKLSG